MSLMPIQLFSVDSNDWGMDLGVGAMGFMTDHVGFARRPCVTSATCSGYGTERRLHARNGQIRFLARHRRSDLPAGRFEGSDGSGFEGSNGSTLEPQRNQRDPTNRLKSLIAHLFPPITLGFEQLRIPCKESWRLHLALVSRAQQYAGGMAYVRRSERRAFR
jgi:hypothetical protein